MPLRQYDPGMRLVGADPRQWERLAVFSASGSIAAFGLIWLSAPAVLVLPIFSAACLLTGLSLAGAAWKFGARRHLNCVTCWDVAGSFLVVGFFAGALAEHEHVANLTAAALY